MEKQNSKLNQREEHELSAQEQTRHETAQEFASVEALLRHDAAQTPVPAPVAQRLQQSLATEPKPVRPWWQRWLGR